MHKLALKGVAKVTRIDLNKAARTTRQNPLLESEIHIDEELINLKETLDSYHTAGETLKAYPTMRSHLLRERRTIMQHTIGLIARMLQGKKLPHDYTREDIDYAVKRLVSLVVNDSRRTGMHIDNDVMDVFRPFMTMRQRMQLMVRL